jgi:hypothetical protein
LIPFQDHPGHAEEHLTCFDARYGFEGSNGGLDMALRLLHRIAQASGLLETQP